MAYQTMFASGSNYRRAGYKKPAPAPVERKRLSNPSEYQTAVFEAIKEMGQRVLFNFRNGVKEVVGLHIEAKAGCSKTTTMVEKDYFLPIEIRNDSVQVAFNSVSAAELKDRVAPGVEAKTLHSLGRAALVKVFPNLARTDINHSKYDGYIRAELGSEAETQEARQGLKSIVDKARDCCFYAAGDMQPLIDRFDIETGHLSEDEFLRLAEKVLVAGLNDTSSIDFGDMISIPLYQNLTMRKYSAISVDEAQDLCPSQHELLKRSIKPGGLFCSVGDKNQAIYLFRSADPESIDRLCALFSSKTFLLPRTYRCGKAIVRSAQEIVPEIEYGEDQHEGEVIELPIEKLLETVKVGDVIISRINAPLIRYCFQLIRMGIPANIRGRDVGDGLKSLVKKSKAKTVNDLLDWVNRWCETETERRTKQKKSSTYVQDQAACLNTLCEGLYEVSDVISAIDNMFSDKSTQGIVLLTSIHKSKGLEWNRVFLLESTCMLPSGNEQEEKNLVYVGRTRARNSLYKVIGREK
jgi:DNA helicase-2/ATP-dependent DNA helicase PcrA